MRRFIRRLLAAKSTKLFALFLVVAMVANPELLSLVSVLAVIGVDAFVLMVLWQLRGYFDIGLMYAQRLLNIRPKQRAPQALDPINSVDDADATTRKEQ